MRSQARRRWEEVVYGEQITPEMELGLIRDISVDGGQVEVRMVLTTPDCPLVEYLVDQIRRKVKSVNGIETVEVTLLDEPWYNSENINGKGSNG